jgi:hypothetical protein
MVRPADHQLARKGPVNGAGEAHAEVTGPREKLLAVFGAYGEWLVGEDFRGCAFANAAAEIPDLNHPARIVARRHKEGVKEYLITLSGEAGFHEPQALAERLLLLLEGATATDAMRHSEGPLDVARSAALELMDAGSSL